MSLDPTFDDDRVRVLKINCKLWEHNPGEEKWMWLALLRKLPDDARIMKMRTEHEVSGSYPFDTGKYHYLKVWSMSFDICPHGSQMPEHAVSVYRADIDAEKAKSKPAPISSLNKLYGECICDMQYTGMRVHRSDCPKK